MSDQDKTRRDLLQRALRAVEEVEARYEALRRASREPIAVVGVGCRFPGAASPEAYWELLQRGRDVIREVPAERWDKNDPAFVRPGETVRWFGGFLDEPVDRFDAGFFGIAGREADALDPQQRLVLECSWEALESAGIAPDSLRGSDSGVVVGITTNDFYQLAKEGGPARMDVYTATGSALNAAPGRVAYTLGLHGPTQAVDAACASSLVAVHQAVRALRNGEADLMLAGGVNVLLAPEPFVCFSRWGMMAPDGRCKTFDGRADGFVRGEGCGMIVLKRLSDAQAAGDPILAVIRGSAVNHDGRSSGFTVPNGISQKRVLEKAIEDAGVAPAAIDYVEAHGTGTTLGDPIEVEAIGSVLGRQRGERPLVLASVKTNIGHLESAAGIAGLIKVVLSLANESIPPHLHLESKSERVPWPSFPVEIPTASHPWPRGESERLAGVSGFGFSGTNAHVVLGEAPPAEEPERTQAAVHLLPLQARDEPALRELAGRLATFIESDPDLPLADICHTAAVGRARLPERAAFVGVDSLQRFAEGENPPDAIRGRSEGGAPRIAFLFTGQGSQYAGMGAKLYASEPVFAEVIDRCDAALERRHRLLDVLRGEAPDGTIDRTEYTQPALYAIEVALAALWKHRGIEPAVVLGHSVGEYAAAHVAGVFDLEAGLKLIAERARLMQTLPEGGAMLALFAPAERVERAIESYRDRLSIAALNGPENVVISGDEAAVDAVKAALAEEGIKGKRLVVSHAFHSPLMDPMLDAFAEVAGKLAFDEPTIELIANGTGEVATPGLLTDPRYWVDHVRGAVRFAPSVETLVEGGCDVALEVGPAPVLVGMAGRCAPEAEVRWVESLRKGRDEPTWIARATGALWSEGARPNWEVLHPGARRVALPTYPFQRERHWLAPTPARGVLRPAETTGQPLWRRRVIAPSVDGQLFETVLPDPELDWLAEHRVFGTVLVPGAWLLESARQAAVAASGSDAVLEDFAVEEPLAVDPERPVVLQARVADGKIELHSFDAAEASPRAPRRHATARVGAAGEELSIAAPQTAREKIEHDAYYEQLRALGLDYGPTFRGVRELVVDETVEGRLEIDGELGEAPHPGLIDACFQLLGPLLDDSDGSTVWLPVGVERYRRLGSPRRSWIGRARLRESAAGAEVAIGDVVVDGVLAIEGLRLKRASAEALRAAVAPASRPVEDLYEVRWVEHSIGTPESASGRWLVVAEADSPVAAALRAELEGRGAEVERAEIGQRVGGEFEGVVLAWTPAPDAEQEAPGERIERDLRRIVDGTLDLARQHAPARGLTLLTRGAQALGDLERAGAPSGAALWGLARTLDQEIEAFPVRAIDLDTAGEIGADVAAGVDALLAPDDGERQFALRDGLHRVQRLVEATTSAFDAPYQLDVTERGTLDALAFAPEQDDPAQPGEVLIRVHATGMNFRDVLNTLGMYPGDPGPLGNECAGEIVALGEGVTRWKLGDRVMAISERGYATHARAREAMCAPWPAGYGADRASTIPIAFLTAQLALFELGKLQRGERVLIHAGAGGVGMAAIQLARRAGAEIFATAGSPRKRAHLKGLGIRHVYDSRSTRFAEELLAATEGRGVDVILNSLTGEMLDASFLSLAKGGRFLEIGKAGIWSEEEVRERRPDATYHIVFLGGTCIDEPQTVVRMYDALLPAFDAGELDALPMACFPIERAPEAFRYMSKARHIGKVVVTDDRAIAAGTRELDPEGAYLVTGGRGGLGAVFTDALLERGAGKVYVAGRSAADAEPADPRVEHVRLDVSDAEQVDAWFAKHSIRGLIHAAGVLDDALVAEQDSERVARVLAPKAIGAWNLHRATDRQPLDFFVSFGAGAGLFGSAGQANYAAANAYLDGLAAWRRARGRAGATVHWGPWAEVGMAARQGEAAERRREAQGIGAIAPAHGVALFERLLADRRVQAAAVRLDWGTFLESLGPRAPRLFETMRRSAPPRTESTATRSWRDELDGLDPERRQERLGELVERQVVQVLGLPTSRGVSRREGLTELGMDSLMAVELANALGAGLGAALPSTLAFEQPTIDKLVAFVADEVLEWRAETAEATEREEETVAEMAEDDVEASLLDELEKSGY